MTVPSCITTPHPMPSIFHDRTAAGRLPFHFAGHQAKSPGRDRRISRLVVLVIALSPAWVQAPVQAADGPTIKLTVAQENALRIVLAPVRRAESHPITTVPATFLPPPNGRVAVTPAFAGVVTQVSVVEGQTVVAGQVLATVFSRDALAAAGELAQASAEATVAADAQRRTAELVREGIVAGARGEEADARFKGARAMAHAKALGLRTAGADASGRYALRAPIAGRVSHVGPHAGEALDQGVAAFLVDRTDRIQVQATLSATLIGQVRVGDRAVVENVEGHVVSVGSAVDSKTRSVPLLAEVVPRDDFIPGRLTSVALFSTSTDELLSAPRSAIVRLKTQPAVFVKRANGFVAVPVKLVGYAGDVASFQADLPAGAQVATTSVSELKALQEQ